MCHALYLYGMWWRRSECVFGLFWTNVLISEERKARLALAGPEPRVLWAAPPPIVHLMNDINLIGIVESCTFFCDSAAIPLIYMRLHIHLFSPQIKQNGAVNLETFLINASNFRAGFWGRKSILTFQKCVQSNLLAITSIGKLCFSYR